FDEFPATNDRGSLTALFNIVVVEHQINMHDGKKDEEPHQEMVNLASNQVATHQRNGPGEQLRKNRLTHFGIQAKPRNGLQQKSPERTEINNTCQCIMPYTVHRLVLNHQDIHLDHFENLFPLRLFQWDEVIPA